MVNQEEVRTGNRIKLLALAPQAHTFHIAMNKPVYTLWSLRKPCGSTRDFFLEDKRLSMNR